MDDGVGRAAVATWPARSSGRPWLFGVRARPGAVGFAASATSTVAIELEPLAPRTRCGWRSAAAEQHPLPTACARGRGTSDRAAIRSSCATCCARRSRSGGIADLPDSAEAAAMARIDALAPEDRALVRRAAVFGSDLPPADAGVAFDEGCRSPTPAVWERLGELFEEEPDGYLRFRRSLLRDAAYEGLPYRLRRRSTARLRSNSRRSPARGEDHTAALSIHMFLAGSYDKAWRYGRLAGDIARDKSVPSEAARFYRRALDAARRSGARRRPGVRDRGGDRRAR